MASEGKSKYLFLFGTLNAGGFIDIESQRYTGKLILNSVIFLNPVTSIVSREQDFLSVVAAALRRQYGSRVAFFQDLHGLFQRLWGHQADIFCGSGAQ